ncbi:EMIL2-like protein [Mya arenaria]|uniref:EMIL2-like protein n=1 Tax=Mya arenaria TaxID=6604 RepID=A0ABY7EAU7_MYAAR|nr:uncharacterized protein LOC128236033 [Mya arenaria]XP_052806962.1 uncharacterized protein LOC128236135 [Mya arenaria]WAR05524.1 EMIL2-like protein [Mya arenaria]WAR06062.1 EMIL2-like protein [Mya arenaria]
MFKIFSCVILLGFLCQIGTGLFTARKPTNLAPKNGTNVVFGTVVVNDGDRYNSTSGVFTAARGGDYLFTGALCPQRAKGFYFGITQNGVEQTRASFTETDGHVCHTFTAILRLKRHDKVALRSENDANLLNEDAARWNMFYGVKV